MSQIPKRIKRPEAVKSSLLDAAALILINKGIQAFTLDLVAKEAGVSKGGLLHHFANKKALLDGLFMREVESFRQDIVSTMQSDPENAGRAARAYIGFGSLTAEHTATPPLLRHLLALMLIEPQICQEWTRHYWDTIKSVGLFEEMTPTLLLSCLAADGLSLWDILGVDIIDEKVRKDLYGLIEKLTKTSKKNS